MNADPQAPTGLEDDVPGVTERLLNRALLASPVSIRRRALYRRTHRRPLSLRRPRTYTEKINWRMVYDRRPLLTVACDKQAMKDLAEQRCGQLGLRIPQTAWLGTDLTDLAALPNDVLPPAWVLKLNDGSGYVHFGTGPAQLDRLAPLVEAWTDRNSRARWGEWGYAAARPLLMVEERIGTDSPDDYKFFVFDGQPRLIQVDTGRFDTHRRRFYTPEWGTLPHAADLPLADIEPAPADLDRMLHLAGALGAGFDHIRVDLYRHDGDVWFGELTPYSGSGLARFEPADLDGWLGAQWQLPRLDRTRSWRRTVAPDGRSLDLVRTVAPWLDR